MNWKFLVNILYIFFSDVMSLEDIAKYVLELKYIFLHNFNYLIRTINPFKINWIFYFDLDFSL